MQNRIRTDGRIDLSTSFVPRNIPHIAAVAVFRLVLKRVWRDIRDSRNGGHCLLTVGGRLRGDKIGAKCVKYAWLSCPARPSRWVLCISMQWLRLKGCHVACDECASGEICSHQHMWVTGLSYGQSRVVRHWNLGSTVQARLTDFRELTAREITGFDCIIEIIICWNHLQW